MALLGRSAFVRIGNKIGYIDKTGQIVVQAQFETAEDFSHGLAFVGVGDKFGYIDKTGRYVWNPTKTATESPQKISRKIRVKSLPESS